MDNRVKLSSSSINQILEIVKSKDNDHFIFIDRDIESGKNPRCFMIELGIDEDDVINIIKNLTKDNFIECMLDKKNEYVFLYVWKTTIDDVIAYIKIGFLYNDKTGDVFVVSFHEDMEVWALWNQLKELRN